MDIKQYAKIGLIVWFVFLMIIFVSSVFSAECGVDNKDCGTKWRQANLTWYESYPEPGSDECIKYNGCQWQGQFAGVNGVKSETWVKNHNIFAVHSRQWGWLHGKKIRVKQGNKEIVGTVYDYCSAADCKGCESACPTGRTGFLIDMEKYTKQRFGASSGTVQWQICK